MTILFFLIVVLFSAIIHEYMHGWMAERLGDPTARDAGRLTLNPMAHLDVFGSFLMPLLLYFGTAGSLVFGYAKPVPFNPYNLRDQKYGSAKVAVAGPLANFITAVFFGVIIRFVPITSSLYILLYIIIQVNIMLMVFNLIPIPPLDGSKVILPFLPYNWQVKYLSMERYGFFFILLFIIFGFSLILPIISFFTGLIAGQPF
jgi:Zn-dependent protease